MVSRLFMCAGAGALISRTAMERNTFDAAHGYIRALPVQSGDAMLSRAFWFMFALAPTDPGAARPALRLTRQSNLRYHMRTSPANAASLMTPSAPQQRGTMLNQAFWFMFVLARRPRCSAPCLALRMSCERVSHASSEGEL